MPFSFFRGFNILCAPNRNFASLIFLSFVTDVSRLVPAQDPRANPARIIFFDPAIIEMVRANLAGIRLVIYSAERKRLHVPSLRDMKIAILVPTDDMKEKVPD